MALDRDHLGQRCAPAQQIERIFAGEPTAGDDRVDTFVLQRAREHHCVRERGTAREAVDQVDLRHHRQLRHDRPHPTHDLERQSHATFAGSAPPIAAPIGRGAEELAQEVAVAEVELDRIEAGLAREHGRSHERLDHRRDVFLAHR